jgi:hypothetical protein
LFLSIDTANKDSIYHVVKKISIWDWETNSLFWFTLDCDACISIDMKAVEAVDFSLQKIDQSNIKAKLCFVMTDSGGDSIYLDLYSELIALIWIMDEYGYHLYYIHAHNLNYSNPVIKYLGIGGVKNQTSL